ncbi:MAG TPA: spore coat protein [Symbiobacteriaceae bacterium]|nr:spore coat protein [Symbiobacteriaceae bacterium]
MTTQQQIPQPQFTFEGGHLVMFHNEVTGLNLKDPNVNDKDRMTDLLSSAKHISDSYDTAMNEASHDALFQVFKQNHSKVKDLERQIYTTMFKKGWYKLPVADAQSVATAFENARKVQSQLPFPAQMPSASGSRAPSAGITQAMQQAKSQQGLFKQH